MPAKQIYFHCVFYLHKIKKVWHVCALIKMSGNKKILINLTVILIFRLTTKFAFTRNLSAGSQIGEFYWSI